MRHPRRSKRKAEGDEVIRSEGRKCALQQAMQGAVPKTKSDGMMQEESDGDVLRSRRQHNLSRIHVERPTILECDGHIINNSFCEKKNIS
jgi:hypothetical protein